jgi:hypothetical protein
MAEGITATRTLRSVLELLAGGGGGGAATLLCLDLDDVCMTVAETVGSEAWESALARELGGGGMADGQARGAAGQMWRALNWVAPTRTPEPGTAAVVQELQHAAAHVVGLTARDAVLAPLTRRQLLSHGIDLKPAATSESRVELGGGVVYSDGVIFCSNRSKHEALRRYLCAPGAARAQCGQPALAELSCCIHVDDKHSHLTDLAAGFKGAPDDSGGLLPALAFRGVHYTRVADEAGADADGSPSQRKLQLDPMTLALARALGSPDSREHLAKAIAVAGGDQTLFYSKY